MNSLKRYFSGGFGCEDLRILYFRVASHLKECVFGVKVFRKYCVYIDDSTKSKSIFLICDDTIYVKNTNF